MPKNAFYETLPLPLSGSAYPGDSEAVTTHPHPPHTPKVQNHQFFAKFAQ